MNQIGMVVYIHFNWRVMFHPKTKLPMNTKSKQDSKSRTKKPKPNLHGPNSPTPKKKGKYDNQEDDNDGYVITKTKEVSSEVD